MGVARGGKKAGKSICVDVEGQGTMGVNRLAPFVGEKLDTADEELQVVQMTGRLQADGLGNAFRREAVARSRCPSWRRS